MEYSYRDELYHHGILGQRWGVRRYQNPDGTLTAAGKKHKKYLNSDGSLNERGKKKYGEYGLDNRPSHKEISDERFKMGNSYTNRKIKEDAELSEWEKEIDKFEKKYGLDKFDSGDAKDDYYYDLVQRSHKDPKLADEIDKYEQVSDAYGKKYSDYYKQGQEYADKQILAKYGTDAAKDTYKSDNAAVGAIIVGSILLSPIIIPAALITVAISTAIPSKKKTSKQDSKQENKK